MQSETPGDSRRQHLMALFSRADATELEPLLARAEALGPVRNLRGPETGMVLVRGRIGGGGSPFPLGEVSVSRASVALSNGIVGHGHVLGSDRDAATRAALADGLAQHSETAALADAIGQVIATRIAAEDAALADETAATRVDFFTLVRGED